MKTRKCKNCANRKIGCHATCEEYLADKEVYENEKRMEREAKQIDRCLWNTDSRQRYINKERHRGK